MSNYKPEDLDKFFNQAKKLLLDPQNKLRAIDLRDFLDKLYLREGEISKLDLVEVNKSIKGLQDRIRHIEECLGIDFDLDKEEPDKDVVDFIDYSFIQEHLMREKVTAYYREMLRYKYGTRNHIICFGEFCRLAIMQLEVLLNYFFSDERNFELVKDDVVKIAEKQYNKAFDEWNKNRRGQQPQKRYYIDQMIGNKEEAVLQLVYSIKSKIFCNQYLKKTYISQISIVSISKFTSDMRNRKSHGSKTSLKPYEEDYLTEEQKTNLENWEKKLLDSVEQFNKAHEKQICYEKKRLNAKKDVWTIMPAELKELYNNKFLPLQWVNEKPFNDVHQLLRIVASTCAKGMKKSR